MTVQSQIVLNFPGDIQREHKLAIEQAASLLQIELGAHLVGLLIAGSIVTTQADRFSDVDLFVAFEGDWCQRRRAMINGIEVDFFVECNEHLMEEIGTGRNEILIETYSKGSILYDPRGFVAKLQKAAQEGRRRFFAKIGDHYFVDAQRLLDSLKSFLRFVDRNQIDETFHMQRLLTDGFNAYYHFAHRWRPSAKYILADILANEPNLYSHALSLLVAAGVEKARAANDFVDFIFSFEPTARAITAGPKVAFRSQSKWSLKVGGATVHLPNLSKWHDA